MTDPAVTAHHSNRAAFISQLDTRPRTYQQPLATVRATCTTCPRWDSSGPCLDHHEAIDRLTSYGWALSPGDAWTCPDCLERQYLDALDIDDQFEGRHRDNTNAAIQLARRARP